MEKKAMTIKTKVEKLLKGRKKGLTPTEIGTKLGYERRSASAMVGPALKTLVAAGTVKRVDLGGKRVEYSGAA